LNPSCPLSLSLSLSLLGEGGLEDISNKRLVGGIVFISYSLLYAVCELRLYIYPVDTDGHLIFTCVVLQAFENGQKV